MNELEVKAQTRFTGRTSPITASSEPVLCTVDECLHKASMSCEVTVTNNQLVPASETHHVPLCETHANAGDTLKWEWRLTGGGSTTPRLKLEAVFALDTLEDRP